MPEKIPDHHSSSPADYLAAERTFLAWIRTGIALMGFGFVVARFGLFLQTMQIVEPKTSVRHYPLSPWFGTSLIVIGVAVNLISAWRHKQLIDELKQGGDAFRRPSSLAIGVALSLAILGLALAVYLLLVGR